MTSALPERLRHARRAFLATVGLDQQPHVVPVCFAESNGKLYIAIDEKPKSGRELKRLRNIKHNPRVSLTVDHYEDDWNALWWVMVQGTASVLSAGRERPEALGALRAKYAHYGGMALEALPLIEFRVERVVAWSARSNG